MALNFPDSPTNGQVALVGGKNYTYNSTKNTWTPTQVTEADLSTVGSTTVVATHDLLPASPSAGDMALVSSVNKMYVYFLSGWWLMSSLQNASPSGITGNAAIYDLAADGTPTTVTLSSSDPEGFPISWSHSIISGSLGGTTVTNVNNVFTITPSTDAADAGTFTLRFAASDGQGGESGSQSQFTLDFVFTITNSRYTTLLATAVDASDNNNITDASTNTHSITVNGDAYAGTFSPYRSRGYSTYFEDTAANVLYASPSSDFAFGTGAFTISVWVKLLHQWLGTIFDTNDGSNPGVMMAVNNTHFYTYSNTFLSSTPTSSQDVWQHFCWTRDGSGNNKVFINGTQATTFTDSTNYTSQNFKMGEEQNGTNDLKAYVKDLHIVKGYAYEPDSTYADGAAEPTTGTVFLGCSLPYHGDKSSSSKTLTVANSGISIVSDTSHDYNEYSATDHGGSVYFDGAGDRITASTSNNFAIGSSEDFIIEAWIYPTNTSQGNFHLFGIHQSTYNGGIYFDYHSSDFRIGDYGGGWDVRTTSTVPLIYNTWQHICASRTGNLIKIFFNGESLALSTQGQAHTNSYNAGDIAIGGTGVGTDFQGFISDIRFEKGTSRTSNFTPPTTPLSSTGAELHIKGTDASVIDKSQGSNLKLEGSTTGSTTQVKFANTKSMKFDSLDDKISVSGVLDLSQACTWEAWVYFDNHPDASGFMHMFQSASYSSTNPPFGIRFKTTGSAKINFVLHTTSGDHEEQTASGVALDTWHHLAFSRTSSGVYNIYLNGTRYATFTESATYQSAGDVMVIGNSGTGSTTARHLDGYMQDIRITQGLARYTAADETGNIPTAPLEG